MTEPGPDPFDEVAAVADAVLFEGYLLYPYRASAQKNQVRWQWGVLLPGGVDPGTGEPDAQRVEFLLEPRPTAGGPATLRLRVRFLRLERRILLDAGGAEVEALDVGDARHLAFDEGVPDHEDAGPALADLAGGVTVPITRPAARTVEELSHPDGTPAGRLIRAREPVHASALLTATELPGPYDVCRVRLEVRNDAPVPPSGTPREEALRTALIGTHTLLAAGPGAFLSPVDPPEWAAPAVADCVSERCWAALAGPADRSDLLLCSPIILGDHAEIAPESGVNLFDGTENDEILTLRTMALTDAEKAEARATDPRAAAIVDAVDGLPPEMLERLHGAIRSLDPAPGGVPTLVTPSGSDSPEVAPRESTPWWDPGADASVDPETDAVPVDGVPVSRGSAVLLRPGSGSDAQDRFLDGMRATVQAVVHDVDGGVHVAVSVDDDPAAELALAHGRFRYFRPGELEPVR